MNAIEIGVQLRNIRAALEFIKGKKKKLAKPEERLGLSEALVPEISPPKPPSQPPVPARPNNVSPTFVRNSILKNSSTPKTGSFFNMVKKIL